MDDVQVVKRTDETKNKKENRNEKETLTGFVSKRKTTVEKVYPCILYKNISVIQL